MRLPASRTLVLVALVIIAQAGVALSAEPSSYLLDGARAKAFCASPAFKTARCGLRERAEGLANTTSAQCTLCGTAYRGLDVPPAEIEGVDRYPQEAIDVISLACKGPVVVRSVFKVLEQPAVVKDASWDGTDCTFSALRHIDEQSLASGASPVVRCELELPASGGGSETQRALASKETRCYKCGYCSQGGGCPSAVGKWYSDSYTTVTRGCDFDAATGYRAHRVGININPETKVLLAKFEVCSSPGCFDAKREAAKLAAAKACVKGKCA